MVNPISIQGNTNYDYEDGFRCERYFRSMIHMYSSVCQIWIHLSDYLRMNVANLRVIRAVIGSVAMVPLTSSGFRHKYGIVLVGNSIARLILNCLRGRFQINAFKLIYIKCSGPHADESIKATLNHLRSLNLGRKDCVVLDLLNNSIPITQSQT